MKNYIYKNVKICKNLFKKLKCEKGEKNETEETIKNIFVKFFLQNESVKEQI